MTGNNGFAIKDHNRDGFTGLDYAEQRFYASAIPCINDLAAGWGAQNYFKNDSHLFGGKDTT